MASQLLSFCGRGTGSSRFLFLFAMLVSSATAQTNTFTATSTIGTTSDFTRSPRFADFDNDGDVDIAFYSDGTNYRLYKNDGTGLFANTFTTLVAVTNMPIEVADMDNDGDVDLVDYNGKVWVNNGSGSFSQLSGVTLKQNAGGGIGAIKLIDFNGDGKRDVVWGNNATGATARNEVWLNSGTTGAPAFTYTYGFSATNGNSSIDVGDIDNDGDNDILLGASANGTEVFKNNDGVFTAGTFAGTYSAVVKLNDWDKDGDLDLLTWSTYNGVGMRVFLNNGSGTFGSLSYTAPVMGGSIDYGDVNGDGYLDALISNGTGGTTNLLINNGCALVERTNVAVNGPHGSFLADFNADGRPDVFIASRFNTTTNLSQIYTSSLGKTNIRTAPGNALNFDGANDYVSVPDANSLDLTTNYTIEAWIRPTAFSALAGIVSKNQVNGSAGYTLRLSGTAPFTGINFDGLETATGVLEAGRWYHIAAVKSGTTRTLYVNGVAVTMTGTALTTAANTDALTIGVDYLAAPRYFEGSIDEVRLWAAARSLSDVTSNNKNVLSCGTQTGLVAYYKLDNGTVGANNSFYFVANDFTGANNGILTNFALTGTGSNWVESYAMVVPTATASTANTAVGFTANWTAPAVGLVTNYLLDVSTSSAFASFVSGYNGLSVSGTSYAVTGLSGNTTYYYRVRADKSTLSGQGAYSNTIAASTLPTAPGNALGFDGVNDFVAVSSPTAIPIANATYTMEAWMLPRTLNSNGNGNGIIGWGNYGTTNQANAFKYQNGNLANYWWANDLSVSVGNLVGRWSHVACSFDGTTRRIYLNGALVASDTPTGHNVPNAGNFRVGLTISSAALLNSFFDGSLDEVRVWNVARTQAQIQAGMYTTISPSSTGLVAYYSFNIGSPAGTNTGLSTLVDQTSNNNAGTLTNFALSGNTSNWLESYAMVIPTTTAATAIGSTGFTANWTAPTVGTVTNYLLDVSTSSTFASFVPGYNALVVNGTSQAVTGLSGSTTYYYRVRADKASVTGQGGYSNATNLTTNPLLTWTGATNNDWATAANWSPNQVPDGTVDILVASGNPVLNTALTVAANKNLTISGTGTLTVGPTGVLTVAGTVNLNGKDVMLKSDATGTGSIGQVTGSLLGATNVTIERYIPAKRAWRMLSAPLKGTSNNGIAANWQGVANEGLLLFSPTTYNSQTMTGYTTGGNAPNIWRYAAGWQAIPNLTTESLYGAAATDTKPFLVFVTGPQGSANIGAGATATTLKPKGELVTGAVNYSGLSTGVFQVMANPYASAIDPVALAASNPNFKFWMLDPSLGSLGGYVTYDGTNWTPVAPVGNARNIQSGQGFFVRSASGTAFTLQESHKVSGSSTNWFERNGSGVMTEDADKIRILLYKPDESGWKLADGILAVNQASGNNALDEADTNKISNFNESLMFRNGTSNLAIEYRGLPELGDTQQIRMTGTTEVGYQLEVIVENYTNSGLQPALEDTLAGTVTPVPTDGNPLTVPFTGVTATSANPDLRFRIVYPTALGVSLPPAREIRVFPNPVTDGKLQIVLKDTMPAQYVITNLLGQYVQKGVLETETTVLPLSQVPSGLYLITITQGNLVCTKKIQIQ